MFERRGGNRRGVGVGRGYSNSEVEPPDASSSSSPSSAAASRDEPETMLVSPSMAAQWWIAKWICRAQDQTQSEANHTNARAVNRPNKHNK